MRAPWATFFEKTAALHAHAWTAAALPGYLRSHPVTTERIADAQNRARRPAVPAARRQPGIPPGARQAARRGGRRARRGDASSPTRCNDRRFANEPGARYGLAVACCARKEPKRAEAEIARLRADEVASPMVETLAARARLAQGDQAGALAILKARAGALSAPPLRSSTRTLDDAAGARAATTRCWRRSPSRCASIRATRSCTRRAPRPMPGRASALLQHQAQAEVYFLQGSLPAAIEQLQFAQTSGDGNFYELSVVDARLKELRAEHAEELQEARKR